MTWLFEWRLDLGHDAEAQAEAEAGAAAEAEAEAGAEAEADAIAIVMVVLCCSSSFKDRGHSPVHSACKTRPPPSLQQHAQRNLQGRPRRAADVEYVQ